jgi:hypothetical protein
VLLFIFQGEVKGHSGYLIVILKGPGWLVVITELFGLCDKSVVELAFLFWVLEVTPEFFTKFSINSVLESF